MKLLPHDDLKTAAEVRAAAHRVAERRRAMFPKGIVPRISPPSMSQPAPVAMTGSERTQEPATSQPYRNRRRTFWELPRVGEKD